MATFNTGNGSALETWLKQATRRLSATSSAQVRTEIQEHYTSAREAAMSSGATPDQADWQAVAALGSAKAANCQYRSVLLTSAEARMLREGQWEATFICSRPWRKRLFVSLPMAALLAAAVLFLAGAIEAARVLLAGGLGIGVLAAAPFLPIYTPLRGPIFRVVKWLAVIGMLVLAFGPDTQKWAWLMICSLWPLASTEWTRASIRRKLPVTEWPRHLYL